MINFWIFDSDMCMPFIHVYVNMCLIVYFLCRCAQDWTGAFRRGATVMPLYPHDMCTDPDQSGMFMLESQNFAFFRLFSADNY